MSYTTLISTAALSQHLANPTWVVVDCRFTLTDSEYGRRAYQQAHIAGAVYAHLNEDLAGRAIPGQTGRHPLPAVETFARTLSRWGIEAKTQVVVYDDAGGAWAARLWWMLRWLGHQPVAVLDGGWQRWQQEGHPIRNGIETRTARNFVPAPRPHLMADTAEVFQIRTDPTFRLFDSRIAKRYRGEYEPFYPVAGHIPGAISAPFAGNLAADGCFRSVEELRARFQSLLGDASPERAVFYCGSGVNAAHNLLAMAHAGLGEGRLYVGSWSEWIVKHRELIGLGALP